MNDSQIALRQRLTWFLLLRLGITSCLLGVVFLSYSHAGVRSSPEKLLFGSIGFLYLVSLVSGLLLTRVQNLAVFSYTQVVFDILFITGTIILTGGIESPFLFLYHFAILNAAFLLFRRGALIAASLATLTYGGTVDLLYYGVLPYSGYGSPTFLFASPAPGLEFTIRLAANFLSFYAIAFLGSYLTQRLFQVETLLAERNLAFGHLSSLYQGVIQNLESGLLIISAEGTVEYANLPIAEILSIRSNEFTGKTLHELFPQLSSQSLINGPVEFAFRNNGNTSEQVLRLTQSPLTDTYGNQIGALYSVQDVTGIKALERGLKETQELERIGSHSTEQMESFAGLIGRSEAMNTVYQLVAKVADSTSTILISGESGTGKELVACAIHDKSLRAGRPFVPVNCGAIPESLIESELFGHVKGAFTGAINNRPGLFREADSGTIFLDEIGELPLALQVKLLRVLQEREVTPVGSNKGIHVDVRVVAATNRNLEAEIAAGRFREDLFYRLNVITIPLPPLRDRTGDLPLLIHHFLAQFSAANGKTVKHVSPQAMKTLLEHAYPGNIRELENLIQHAVTMTEEDTIHCEDFPASLQNRSQHGPSVTVSTRVTQNGNGHQSDFFGKGVSLDAELEEYEQHILQAALEKAGGVQKKAAEFLGINYRSLRHRLQKYHLS
ncbi:MAG: sigma-54-dependent Fis family transcriptional regulator [Deltaproteobacteria bacterium]|nr:sigma-54-dependent Fis family transcriptional regulator [Deltaproteobacteria bacterium]